MANQPQANTRAREILEGNFALQYFSHDHQNLIHRLEEAILSPNGQVVLLQGNPGCGITMLLSRLHISHPLTTNMLKGDIYLGYWDFVDHLCDAFNVRRSDFQRRTIPAQLLRVLSITGCKALLIDDLDIYIASQDELDQMFSTISTLSANVPYLTFVLSTRNKQLEKRFFKYSQRNWWSHRLTQKITMDEYYDLANRLWRGLNVHYSLDLPTASLEPPAPKFGLDIQQAHRALRLQLAERVMQQQGAVDFLSDYNDLDGYESYVQSIIYS